ncbi:hypothetical protein EV122DRAFT_204764 [Schizophyllum commune]
MANLDDFEAPAPTSIELNSGKDSQTTRVSLYPGRAEVTRVFTVALHTGQNNVVLNGLPAAMDRQSLRVEGRGNATIQDVTVADMPAPPKAETTSTKLDELRRTKATTKQDLARVKKAISFAELYLGTLSVQHTDVDKLAHTIGEYEKLSAGYDSKLLDLEAKIEQLDAEIAEEEEKLEGPAFRAQRALSQGVRVIVSMSAAEDTEAAQIVLVYGVRGASWKAKYDIRVVSQNKTTPVTLVYKAEIEQHTGEDWTNVPLVLETIAPAFGVAIPELDTWDVQLLPIVKPASESTSSLFAQRGPARGALFGSSSTLPTMAPPAPRARALMVAAAAPAMEHSDVQVTSHSVINTTFEVPGLISVPSDKQTHNVIIANLKLDAQLQWITVPKKDTRVFLKANIRNDSEYPLLPGESSVYLDGSFTSRPRLPAVNPQERFDCPLGVDPSIRVTYKPQHKKASKSAFYTFNKTSTTEYIQEIDVFNAKNMVVSLKVVDQIPVAQDSKINVKLVKPALSTAPADASQTEKPKAPKPLRISESVSAQWDGADDPKHEAETLGKNGKVNWLCDVQPQGHAHLTLQWEVSYPAEERILGI